MVGVLAAEVLLHFDSNRLKQQRFLECALEIVRAYKLYVICYLFTGIMKYEMCIICSLMSILPCIIEIRDMLTPCNDPSKIVFKRMELL